MARVKPRTDKGGICHRQGHSECPDGRRASRLRVAALESTGGSSPTFLLRGDRLATGTVLTLPARSKSPIMPILARWIRAVPGRSSGKAVGAAPVALTAFLPVIRG